MTGFRLAERRDAEVLVTMDANGQHPVKEFVQPVLDGEADYVIDLRYYNLGCSNKPVVSRAGIRLFTCLIGVLTKPQITDRMNGYRAVRGSEIENDIRRAVQHAGIDHWNCETESPNQGGAHRDQGTGERRDEEALVDVRGWVGVDDSYNMSSVININVLMDRSKNKYK